MLKLHKDIKIQVRYEKLKGAMGITNTYILCENGSEEVIEVNILVGINNSSPLLLKFLTLIHETFHVILKVCQFRFPESAIGCWSYFHQKWDALWYYIACLLLEMGIEEVSYQ